MARCGCGSSDGGSIANGPNTTVTGSGTPANPYQIAAHTDCTEARACFVAGDGLTIDPVTGQVTLDVSPAAGNTLTVTPAGLYTTPSASTVTTGNGALGVGTVGDPVRANVDAWDFAGTALANGSRVYVDSTGKLRGEPGYHSYYQETSVTRNYANIAVPAASLADVDVPFNFIVNNPDPARSMRLFVTKEFDCSLNLPAGAIAACGFDGTETNRYQNGGTTAMTFVHNMVSRTSGGLTVGPGASTTITMQSQIGSGTAGATYARVSMAIRVLLTAV